MTCLSHQLKEHTLIIMSLGNIIKWLEPRISNIAVKKRCSIPRALDYSNYTYSILKLRLATAIHNFKSLKMTWICEIHDTTNISASRYILLVITGYTDANKHT